MPKDQIFLKRTDFDTIIKAFYNEISKQATELDGEALHGLKVACRTFDQVTKAFKDSVRDGKS